MYTFNWALTAFRSESYIGSATALPDIHTITIVTRGAITSIQHSKSYRVDVAVMRHESNFRSYQLNIHWK